MSDLRIPGFEVPFWVLLTPGIVIGVFLYSCIAALVAGLLARWTNWCDGDCLFTGIFWVISLPIILLIKVVFFVPSRIFNWIRK